MDKMEQATQKPKPAPKPEIKSEAKPEAKSQVKSVKPASGGKIAVILIRNTVRAGSHITDTLKMLNLHTKFSCSVFDNTPSTLGMIVKVKDYITYGEIDAETIAALEQKRGQKDKDRKGKLKKTFHLQPPRGGFERKGIKHSFTQGGVIGYRGAKIKDLINKML